MILVSFIKTRYDNYVGKVKGTLQKHDAGRKLSIVGLDLPKMVQIDFYYKDEAIPMLGTTTDGVTIVDIPNSLLVKDENSDYTISVYIYVLTEDGGKTVHQFKLNVIYRPVPSATNFLPNDQADMYEVVIKTYTEEYLKENLESVVADSVETSVNKYLSIRDYT